MMQNTDRNGIKKNRIEIFNEDTSWEIREQILRYHAAALMSDIERAKFLGLPHGCRIRENAKILRPENFVCGEYVHIGEGVILDASGGLTIGNHTSIGPYVAIWTHSSHMINLKGENIPHSPDIIRKPTKIGNNCFIGTHSVIMPGITVGDKVVIQPLSLVDEDIPNNTVYGSFYEVKKLQRKVEKLETLVEKLIERKQND